MSNGKQLLRVAAAAALYLLAGALIFHRALLDGLLIAPGDGLLFDYPLRTGAHAGDIWQRGNSLGMPLAGMVSLSPFYPLRGLAALGGSPFSYNLYLILHLALAATGMFVFLLRRHDPRAALAGGMLAGYGGFMTAHQGHVSILTAAAWLPWVLCSADRFRATLRLRFALLAGTLIGLQFLAGHTQIALQSALLFGAFMLSPQDPADAPATLARRAGAIALSGCIAIIVAAPQLAATVEMLAHSARGSAGPEFTSHYAYSPAMLPNLIFPFAFGDGLGSRAWGAVYYSEFSGFLGASVLVIAVLGAGALWRKNEGARFWLGIAALALLLAFGGHFAPGQLLHRLPPFNMFRAACRYLLSFNIAVIVLFAGALTHWLAHPAARTRRLVSGLIAAFAAGAGLLAWVISRSGDSAFRARHQFAGAPIPAFAEVFRQPALWGMIALALAAAGLVLFGLRLRGRASGALLCAAAFIEIAPYAAHVTRQWPRPRAAATWPTQAIAEILRENPGRLAVVTPEPEPLLDIAAGRARVNGFDPLVSRELSALTGFTPGGFTPDWPMLVQNNALLSALSTRFVLTRADRPLPGVAGALAGECPTAPLLARKPGGSGPALAATPVQLTPGADYRIELEAEVDAAPDAPLVADLYGGPAYDDPERDAVIEPGRFAAGRARLEKTVSAGAAPADAQLRLFTFSTRPIRVLHAAIRPHGVERLPADWPPATTELSSADGLAAALITFPVRLLPRTDYLLAVRLSARKPLAAPVFADLYAGPAYDTDGQQMRVEPALIGPAPRRFTLRVNSGAAPADGAAFRVFSFGKPPVRVEGASLREFSGAATLACQPPYRRVAAEGDWILHENLRAAPRIRTVAQLSAAPDARSVRERFRADEPDPPALAFVTPDALARLGGGPFATGPITPVADEAERIEFTVRLPGPGFVVVADQHYPGWKATVDGLPAAIHAVNGVMRGVAVPAGEHRVRMQYVPAWRRVALRLGALGLLAAWMLGWLLRRGRPTTGAAADAPPAAAG